MPGAQHRTASPPLWAHSASAVSGLRQSLQDHLRGTALLAKGFGEVFGAGEAAAYLGLVHDCGKACRAWQDRLLAVEPTGEAVGVPHKEAGTRLAGEHLPAQYAVIVEGHHGGMPDWQAVKGVLRSPPDGQVTESLAKTERLVPEVRPGGRIPLPEALFDAEPAEAKLRHDLLIRMLFSCLVDADSLDTAAHANHTRPRLRPTADMAELADRYEKRRAVALSASNSEPESDGARRVAAARQTVYEHARAAAEHAPGFYRLHVPTGGAKTHASGGFALRHAAAHGKRRVIVAVPYMSITEQNADVYRRLLDPSEPAADPVVLEHHSSVDLEGAHGPWAELASENWDAPFVVTTTVQLFESLFSNRRNAARKVHRLADSVIVLDEVQALPDRLLRPILSGLRGLVECFGSTVLLSSATQPDFWALDEIRDMPQHDVVADATSLFDTLRRVRYEWRLDGGVTLDSIAEELAEHRQVLAIVNTTRDAALLHRLLADDGEDEEPEAHGADAPVPGDTIRPPAAVFHLSTRMTSGHRRRTIAAIKERLRGGAPVRVVSTQLIEAGVDLSFPHVYRAFAPADSLQQAAGRCNREGALAEGVVVVFRPEDGGQPDDETYKHALGATEAQFGPDRADPDDIAALKGYYQQRYSLQYGPRAGMGAEIQASRRDFKFAQVARDFRMIADEYSRPVVVLDDGGALSPERPSAGDDDARVLDQAKRVVQQLRQGLPCGPDALRALQPHIASLPRWEADRAAESGHAEPLIGDLLLWQSSYHPQRGIDPFTHEDRSQFVQ